MNFGKIEKLVKQYNLGDLVIDVTKVTGGLSHRMYKVVTEKGTYAVKELNSGVMKRQGAYANFVFSEKVTDIVKKNGISAVGALKLGKDIMAQIDGVYFMVFDWLEGRILRPEEITKKHCEMIGEILAKIHMIDFSTIENEKTDDIEMKMFDWDQIGRASCRERV